MRKALCVLSVAAAAALAVPSVANAAPYDSRGKAAAAGTGAVVGTVVGVGTYNAWWGTGALASTLPTTVAGSAAVGGVAGVGAVALVDAVIQPCRGFPALFGLNSGACANGEYVGYAPRRGPRG